MAVRERGGTRRASRQFPRHMRGVRPAALFAPLGKKEIRPTRTKKDRKKKKRMNTFPLHALARILAIPATHSGSICPRRAARVTPRGCLAVSKGSAPTKNDHAMTVKRARRD
ncbi:uncharacterized protein Tco025E_08960 [Trypanosoma conorhini]|uniref:Uncharacterized protein n=1 Tax=Trypanosoma conorhini TaxID=83891 RepID=A0A422N2H8_9TRYP|nr:uncharacterized protein Tco025E_08960 [Trypanosoma conorhini]RNE99676.1 hypothetical protein Tco025E_08960 [Trypanosoma conorhini]